MAPNPETQLSEQGIILMYYPSLAPALGMPPPSKRKLASAAAALGLKAPPTASQESLLRQVARLSLIVSWSLACLSLSMRDKHIVSFVRVSFVRACARESECALGMCLSVGAPALAPARMRVCAYQSHTPTHTLTLTYTRTHTHKHLFCACRSRWQD